MKSHINSIFLDRPVAEFRINANTPRAFSEADIEAARSEAYQQGLAEARSASIDESQKFRHEAERVQHSVLSTLTDQNGLLFDELRKALPKLALDLAHRLMAGYAPPAELVARICEEALDQLLPERENLELIVSPRDAGQLKELALDWTARYPGIQLHSDEALSPGECMVRSRFGLIDGRKGAKIANLGRALCA